VKAEKAASLGGEPHQKWNSRDQWVQETAQVNSPLAPTALRDYGEQVARRAIKGI